MITHAASRKHYYTVLLDRPEVRLFFFDKDLNLRGSERQENSPVDCF